jgi:hypothetical protein
MFITTAFTIAKLWKQPRCLTTDECNKKMWYIYTMEFDSIIRKNEIMSFACRWTELEHIMLSEVNQVQKDKSCMFPLICGRQIQKINTYTKPHMSIHFYIENKLLVVERRERKRE